MAAGMKKAAAAGTAGAPLPGCPPHGTDAPLGDAPEAGGTAQAPVSFRSIIRDNPQVGQEEAESLISARGTPEWPMARERLVLGSIRLVASVAGRFLWIEGCSPEDVISHGVIGLMKAVDRYDPAAGTAFCTYASYWIKEEICSGLLYRRSQLSSPEYMEKLAARLDRLQYESRQRTGLELSASEAAEAMGISEKKAEAVMELRDRRRVLSIEMPAGGTGDPEDTICGRLASDDDVESQALDRLMSLQAAEEVKKLDPFEQRAVTLRYGLGGREPMTLVQCAKEIGRSDESVRRMLRSAMKKLRNGFSGGKGAV